MGSGYKTKDSHSKDSPRAGIGPGRTSYLEMNKPVMTIQVLVIVKWFDIRNGYRLISKSDKKQGVFVHWPAIKRTTLGSLFAALVMGRL